MIVRTNYLWLGELIGQIVSIVASTGAVLFLLPTFLSFGDPFPDFGYFIYAMFGFVMLLNVGITLWRWRRTEQRVNEVSMHPEQWLAHWSYDHWVWQDYAQAELKSIFWRLLKWGLPFVLIGTFVSVMWMQTFGHRIIVPLLTVMAVNLLILLMQIAILPYYRIQNTAPEAIITREGVLIGGSAYFWKNGNSSLRAVTLLPGQPNILEIKVRTQNGRNSSTQAVRIPVLAGHEAQAQTVVDTLQQRLRT